MRGVLRRSAWCFASALALVTTTAGADAGAPAPASPSPPSPSGAFARPTAFPWLGVSMDAGGDVGVRVERVVRGSPAERGGIRAGDRIVSVDRARVTEPGQVSRAVASRKVGDAVTVGLERAGAARTVVIDLAARPTADGLLRMDLVGAPAPAWTKVTPLAGAPASVAALKGKVVLIDFWASWCGPCRLLAPKLSALQDRLGPLGLEVVGITTDDAERAAAFAAQHRMRYPVVVDADGETSKAHGIASLPTMILIDKAGVVRDVFLGFDPAGDAKLEHAIRALLAERPPSAAGRR